MRTTEPEKVTLSTKELCKRYGCIQVTLTRWVKRRGFPHPIHAGKEHGYFIPSVMEWEREHMPELHPEPARPKDEDTIDLMRAGAKLASDFVIRVEKIKKPKPRKKK